MWNEVRLFSNSPPRGTNGAPSTSSTPTPNHKRTSTTKRGLDDVPAVAVANHAPYSKETK